MDPVTSPNDGPPTSGLEDLAALVHFRVGAWQDFGYADSPSPDCAVIPPLGERSASAVKAGHEAIEDIDRLAARLQAVRSQLVSELRRDEDLRMARDFTHPSVLGVGVAEGWAEAETDPTRINWPERQARAAIPFEVIDGRPVNPCEKTGVTRGRNEMGFWGETLCADALVTCTYYGRRYLLMVERGDGYGWAVPGGHVETGEAGLDAALRELYEETTLNGVAAGAREMPPRYVPDPRSSDEAWAVTIPVHVDLGGSTAMPDVLGGDDARRAEWIPADTFAGLTDSLERYYGGRVFAAHVAMLGDFLGEVAP